MTSKGVSVVLLSNDIEWVLEQNQVADAGTIARAAAEEIMRKYTVTEKPPARRGHEDNPRGSWIW